MSSTASVPSPHTTTVPARWLRVLAPILGALTTLFVILYGVLLDASSGGIFVFAPAFVPAILLAFAVGHPAKDAPGRYWMLAMTPLAIGLLTATVVCGSMLFGQGSAAWWWIIGGLLSAAPFLVTGLVAARHIR